ncbi:hypothetical protein AGLY_010511 [Aphis glycines]|uniref:Uncharacterized protein n=1 Tax=Aphis glycines TaxID=307491 RepID=A0A6G0TDY6_APHGL|nr:hypothetical protein AGLY_010511 [Aphis glycines]
MKIDTKLKSIYDILYRISITRTMVYLNKITSNDNIDVYIHVGHRTPCHHFYATHLRKLSQYINNTDYCALSILFTIISPPNILMILDTFNHVEIIKCTKLNPNISITTSHHCNFFECNIFTFGNASRTILIIAAFLYSLHASAFFIACSASALAFAWIANDSASPLSLSVSASASASIETLYYRNFSASAGLLMVASNSRSRL